MALGWVLKKEDALAGETVPDRWCVLGQAMEEEERVRVRRSWVVGRKTGRRALVLDFAAGAQPLDPGLVAGMEFEGELAFYPAGVALRAVVKERSAAVEAFAGGIVASDSVETELRSYAGALARCLLYTSPSPRDRG